MRPDDPWNNDQELIDICFELVLHSRDDRLQNKSTEEVAAWVADQLRKCGFDTKPIGASWGVLK